jgi:hypothetical protein
MRNLPLPLLALALAGCGPSDPERDPGSLTREEARQLDDAAAATDINAMRADNAVEAQQ